MTAVEVFAPAKVNLTLHVTGRLEDGYHELDSLVVFANVGDLVHVGASGEGLRVEGPEAEGVPATPDNLVARAVRVVSRSDKAPPMRLIKRLPSAAGLGGGSADAAAAIRGYLVYRGGWTEAEWTANDPDVRLVEERKCIAALGADIPMCLRSESCRVRGIGDEIEFVPLPELDAVLVNPRVPVATASVFQRLANSANAGMDDPIPAFFKVDDVFSWLRKQRNDLEEPAISLAPVIGDVLKALGETGCGVKRMSGSGATCFGLYRDELSAIAAEAMISAEHPDWWVVRCRLGDQRPLTRPIRLIRTPNVS